MTPALGSIGDPYLLALSSNTSLMYRLPRFCYNLWGEVKESHRSLEALQSNSLYAQQSHQNPASLWMGGELKTFSYQMNQTLFSELLRFISDD